MIVIDIFIPQPWVGQVFWKMHGWMHIFIMLCFLGSLACRLFMCLVSPRTDSVFPDKHIKSFFNYQQKYSKEAGKKRSVRGLKVTPLFSSSRVVSHVLKDNKD